jgi:hypothetical protein
VPRHDRCRVLDIRKQIRPLVAKRWLYDAVGERHSTPQNTTSLKLLAGRKTYRRSKTVPTAATPGPARYEVTLDYSKRDFPCALTAALGLGPLH